MARIGPLARFLADMESDMSQFVLNTSGAVPANLSNPITTWDNLDAFTQGYIEALFFTESDIGGTRKSFDPENGSTLPGDASFDDLDPDTLGRIVDDCAAFQAANARDLSQAYTETCYGDGSQAGHDYWLTRNGHGAGFWDRDALDWFAASDNSRKLQDVLSDAARDAGSVDVYWGDDGKVYL